MQDFKRAQYWPKLLLLNKLKKKKPTEISEKYSTWKEKEQKDVRGSAPWHCKGRKAVAGLAAQGNHCFIETSPIKCHRSVTSHARGAEEYSRLVGCKNAPTQSWSGDKERDLCVCVQADTGNTSPGEAVLSQCSMWHRCVPLPHS